MGAGALHQHELHERTSVAQESHGAIGIGVESPQEAAMPLGPDASANIEELSKAKAGDKDWPRKRIIAAAIHAAESKKKQRAQADALKA
jgi:hypothetical protein